MWSHELAPQIPIISLKPFKSAGSNEVCEHSSNKSLWIIWKKQKLGLVFSVIQTECSFFCRECAEVKTAPYWWLWRSLEWLHCYSISSWTGKQQHRATTYKNFTCVNFITRKQHIQDMHKASCVSSTRVSFAQKISLIQFPSDVVMRWACTGL